MAVPIPTRVSRLVHVESLATLLARGAIHAPGRRPLDGRGYRPIHDDEVQPKRAVRRVPRGPGGAVQDYVSLYFGERGPMLLELHSGGVASCVEGQRFLVYVVASAQRIAAACRFVFSDGHTLAAGTRWFEDLADLRELDWDDIRARYWKDSPDHPHRQRHKQAEFLVHAALPWSLVDELVVIDRAMRRRVRDVLAAYPQAHHPEVVVRRRWYY